MSSCPRFLCLTLALGASCASQRATAPDAAAGPEAGADAPTQDASWGLDGRAPDAEDGGPALPPPDSLRALASTRNRAMGAALGTYHFGDPAYKVIAGREFSWLTPENEMKWDALEPARGEFNFATADALVAFALQRGMKVRGHTLVWHEALPAWVEALSADELRQAMLHHVTTVVTHFRGRVAAWDVVNEAIADDAPGLRTKSVFAKLGPTFIDDAFRAARAADPDVPLYYNDYGGEGLGTKSDAIYTLLKRLKDAGVPLDGVGLQAHLDPRMLPSSAAIAQNMQRLATLDLAVSITELDVPVGEIPGNLATKLQRQAEIYGEMVELCLGQPRCDGITFWGFTDRYSWLNDPAFAAFRGRGPHYPLPFDANYLAKPAVQTIKDTLRAP